MATSSTRPKRRAAAKAINIIELSDSEENESYEATPEKRQRTIKVITRAPTVPNDASNPAKQRMETKTRKPRNDKKPRETASQAFDENTPPNVLEEERGESQELMDSPEDIADGQCLQSETNNTNDLHNSSMYDEQPRLLRLQGRNSFWGKL